MKKQHVKTLSPNSKLDEISKHINTLQMTWDSDKIRDLRLRLGFSTADMARRLQTDSLEIRSWEIGIKIPAEFQLSQLDLLQKQAEASADEMAFNVLAEQFQDGDELDQIDLTSVKRRFSQNN